MIKIKSIVGGIAVTAGLLSSGAYAETVLKVATWLSPNAPQNAIVWPTWSKWVEEATEGRVKIQLEYGMGHPKTMYDLVEDGVVDASFSVDGYNPGRFVLSGIAELPGGSKDAEAGSVALWKVYKKYFEDSNEYEGLHVLAQFVHGPGQLHTKFPINSLDDLKGKKIRVGGGVATELANRLEVTQINAPATKVYEMLQQGVADGVMFPVIEQSTQRLHEVTEYITAFPGGMYTTSFTFFMNPDTFASLSKKDQAAIMKVSGENLSRLAGRVWGESDELGYKAAEENGVKVTRLTATDPLAVKLKERSAGMDEHWIEKAKKERGIDAEAALKEFRKIVTEY